MSESELVSRRDPIKDLAEEVRRCTALLTQHALPSLGAIERRLAAIEAAVLVSTCGVDEGGSHVLTRTCPVGCLRDLLSARPYNVIASGNFYTVADVVRGVQTRSLRNHRNFGEGSLAEVTRVLREAGLLS